MHTARALHAKLHPNLGVDHSKSMPSMPSRQVNIDGSPVLQLIPEPRGWSHLDTDDARASARAWDRSERVVELLRVFRFARNGYQAGWIL